MDSLLLTPAEAAAELRCSRATLFQLIGRGEIQSVLLGERMRRIPRQALIDYIERAQEAS